MGTLSVFAAKLSGKMNSEYFHVIGNGIGTSQDPFNIVGKRIIILDASAKLRFAFEPAGKTCGLVPPWPRFVGAGKASEMMATDRCSRFFDLPLCIK